MVTTEEALQITEEVVERVEEWRNEVRRLREALVEIRGTAGAISRDDYVVSRIVEICNDALGDSVERVNVDVAAENLRNICGELRRG